MKRLLLICLIAAAPSSAFTQSSGGRAPPTIEERVSHSELRTEERLNDLERRVYALERATKERKSKMRDR